MWCDRPVDRRVEVSLGPARQADDVAEVDPSGAGRVRSSRSRRGVGWYMRPSTTIGRPGSADEPELTPASSVRRPQWLVTFGSSRATTAVGRDRCALHARHVVERVPEPFGHDRILRTLASEIGLRLLMAFGIHAGRAARTRPGHRRGECSTKRSSDVSGPGHGLERPRRSRPRPDPRFTARKATRASVSATRCAPTSSPR